MTDSVRDYDYDLPESLIAQSPPEKRTDSRLLVLNRAGGGISHRRFPDLLGYLDPGDLLVVNETRVRPSRLFGRKPTGGRVETLLLEEVGPDTWRVMVKPAKRVRRGAKIEFSGDLWGEILAEMAAGERLMRFSSKSKVAEGIAECGELALPPYIRAKLKEPERYQTVYSSLETSVAAPTAGLHFTRDLLEEIEAKGVRVAAVSLSIGPDTFRPITADRLAEHKMHSEAYEIGPETVAALDAARARGASIIPVGTTTVRALESWARTDRTPGRRRTDIFITPGFDFMMTDMMLTNFHLPKSTLIVMVSAFGGRGAVFHAYREAVRERYRFYSFGDAMLVI